MQGLTRIRRLISYIDDDLMKCQVIVWIKSTALDNVCDFHHSKPMKDVSTKTRIIRAVGSQKAWAEATGQTPENVSRIVSGKQPEPEWWSAMLELLELIPRGALPKRWWAQEADAKLKKKENGHERKRAT